MQGVEPRLVQVDVVAEEEVELPDACGHSVSSIAVS